MSVRSFFTIVLFLFMLEPAHECLSQPVDQEMVQSDESDVKAKKSDKKKDKDKEVVEINENFFINLAIDLTAVILIISLIYYPNYHDKTYTFTFIIFNLVIFLITFVLNKVKFSMGAAFGLFAVFSMLRYRTEGISMKDMTYLFIFIAIGLICAIQLDFYILLVITGLIVAGVYSLDTNLIIKKEHSKYVDYENIELIKPDRKDELIQDLKNRTGLNIHRVSITKIDFLKDFARISIYYYD
jgi:hypothetical protein